jgi:hypothetical protein
MGQTRPVVSPIRAESHLSLSKLPAAALLQPGQHAALPIDTTELCRRPGPDGYSAGFCHPAKDIHKLHLFQR